MPRNSSGNYTLPAGNPVVPNTLIETTWANPTMADIGAGLTDSLDRYGRGGMLAQLKLADGTAAQPAFAFNAESSTGLFRLSAGVMNLAILGVTVASFGAASVTFSQPPIYAADPVGGNELTRKSYVDTAIATAGGAFLPLTGGVLTGGLAIGGSVVAGRNLVINRAVTGSTVSYGIFQNSSILADVTNNFSTFYSSVATTAAAFNLASLFHFQASQNAFGAGSTVTNQYGFFVNAALIGAANNYGFFGNVPTGAGRWNFYAGGSADNFFAGNVGIGAAPTAKLDLFGTVFALRDGVYSASIGKGVSVVPGAGAADLGISAGTGALHFATGGAASGQLSTAGNLGIGSVAPATRLHASGPGAAARCRVQSTDGGGVVAEFLADSSTAGQIGTNTNHDFRLATNSVPRLIITSNGVIQDAAGLELGYRSLNRVPISGAVALTQAENGKCHYKMDASNITVNNTYTDGSIFTVYNASGSTRSIVAGAGATLSLAGTASSGTRTLVNNGIATIWIVGAPGAQTAVVSGTGVS